MAHLHAYTSLEDTMVSVILNEWSASGRLYANKLIAAVQKQDWNAAYDVANKVTLNNIVEAQRKRIEELGVSALLFGGGQIVAPSKTQFAKTKTVPEVLSHALDQLTVMVEENGTTALRRSLLAFIASQEDEHKATILGIKKMDTEELADALNAVVMGQSKGIMAVGANLTTSRLVSYGFLDEATVQGITTYQVSEVLDTRTCPVCQYMHGKTFTVQSELDRVNQLLRIMDPNELKSAAPWPSQTKAGVAELKSMSAAALQAAGYGSPPYHPLCRGVLVMDGTIDFTIKPTAPPTAQITPPTSQPNPNTDFDYEALLAQFGYDTSQFTADQLAQIEADIKDGLSVADAVEDAISQ